MAIKGKKILTIEYYLLRREEFIFDKRIFKMKTEKINPKKYRFLG